jgi:hypothetical protein
VAVEQWNVKRGSSGSEKAWILRKQILTISFGTGSGEKRVEARLKWVGGYQTEGKSELSWYDDFGSLCPLHPADGILPVGDRRETPHGNGQGNV